ncbi:33336_t:CDS:2, partial [Racocetra persica]
MPQQQLVPSYQGVINSASGGIIGNISMVQIPQEGTNMWTRFDQSIFATYSFLGIGWGAVGSFDPTFSLAVMEMLFSFIAVIMLLNLLIGFMTESFKDSLNEARRAHLRQRAQIIAEIELFLLATSYRYNSDWFPHLIYYEAHADSVSRWR